MDYAVAGVVGGGAGEAGLAHLGGEGAVAEEAEEGGGDEFGFADGGDEAGGPERGLFVSAAFDEFAAGADIGANAGDSGGEGFEDDEGEAFAEAGEEHDIDGGQEVIALLGAGELHVVFQAEAAAEFLTGGGVGGFFVKRAGDEKLGRGELVDGEAGGAEQGFDVFDGDHAAEKADDFAFGIFGDEGLAAGAELIEVGRVDTIGDDFEFVRRGTEFDLKVGIPPKECGDTAGGLIGKTTE